MENLVLILTHLEQYLVPLLTTLGSWSYLMLFAVIFLETGMVVFPFLPGESLIFLASTMAATHTTLSIQVLVPVFFVAAVIGDTVNYEIGRHLIRLPWLQRHLPADKQVKAQAFFSKYGSKAVMFGRFVPLIRTFVPLTAGASKMPQKSFALWNLLGVGIWVAVGCSLGYFFGSISFVQDHLSLCFLGIMAAALIPAATLTLVKTLRRRHPVA
ncbi:DedA family protein [Lactiplantibacillus fabifermentans]|uniref:Membrane protein n=1 Tax=Lactiplantibacillus fabifermentans T30PCM01 TaxID=1400520 RepID=W6TCV7_9LACO|nr:VTT domain-containing protein [Lactiplantibacillus fabifermentans]ETY75060.1 membrane protein [Lactiplantibacillus fabifermentans T30PCM01]